MELALSLLCISETPVQSFGFEERFDHPHRNSDSCLSHTHIHSPAGTHLPISSAETHFLYLPVKSSARSWRLRAAVNKPCQLWGPICIHNFCQRGAAQSVSQPLWRAAAPVHSNLNLFPLTCTEYMHCQTHRFTTLSVAAWPERCQDPSEVLSNTTWSHRVSVFWFHLWIMDWVRDYEGVILVKDSDTDILIIRHRSFSRKLSLVGAL